MTPIERRMLEMDELDSYKRKVEAQEREIKTLKRNAHFLDKYIIDNPSAIEITLQERNKALEEEYTALSHINEALEKQNAALREEKDRYKSALEDIASVTRPDADYWGHDNTIGRLVCRADEALKGGE